jgi:hypothetical protein
MEHGRHYTKHCSKYLPTFFLLILALFLHPNFRLHTSQLLMARDQNRSKISGRYFCVAEQISAVLVAATPDRECMCLLSSFQEETGG